VHHDRDVLGDYLERRGEPLARALQKLQDADDVIGVVSVMAS